MSGEKEVIMDVKEGPRRRRRTTRRATEKENPVITKAEAEPSVAVKPLASASASVVKKPVVVIAPPKKKAPKVMLVPKPKGSPAVKSMVKKTFKAKKVAVTINNTAKTQKQHRSIVQNIDAMTDDQVRAAACTAKLSRRETVAKVPITLLKEMLKDCQLMKKMLH